MAFPNTIIATASIKGNQPIIKSSAGNFYAVTRDATSDPEVLKVTDLENGTFVAQDTGNTPATTLNGMSIRHKGDKIHIVHWTTDVLSYSCFDMATDLWVGLPTLFVEVVDTWTTNPVFPWADIDIRDNGDIVIVGSGDPDSIKGGDKERVDYWISTDGGESFSTATALGVDADDVHDGNPIIIKGALTDDMHIVWQHTANTDDPPTAWTDVHMRTLSPSNVLSALAKSLSHTAGAMLGFQQMVAYEDAGTQRMAWLSASPTIGEMFRTTEDGSDDIQAPTVVEAMSATAQPFINGEAGIFGLVEEAGVLYALYSNSDDSQDIWYITSTDDGATISTEVQELDAVTCNYLSVSILEVNEKMSLVYKFDDGGNTKVHLKVLAQIAYTQLDNGSLENLVNTHVGPFQI